MTYVPDYLVPRDPGDTVTFTVNGKPRTGRVLSFDGFKMEVEFDGLRLRLPYADWRDAERAKVAHTIENAEPFE